MLRTNLKSVPDFDKSVLASLCCQNIIGSYRYETIYAVPKNFALDFNYKSDLYPNYYLFVSYSNSSNPQLTNLSIFFGWNRFAINSSAIGFIRLRIAK